MRAGAVCPALHRPPCLQDWLTSIEIKYYESKVNLNWKNILKSIKEVRPAHPHSAPPLP